MLSFVNIIGDIKLVELEVSKIAIDVEIELLIGNINLLMMS